MKSSIYQSLEKLQLTSKETRSIFNEKTRDVDELIVWKDQGSGVIYIEDFYAGDNEYIDGFYRKNKIAIKDVGKPDYERCVDAQRRLNSNYQFIAGKRVADFGCGRGGDFLRIAKPHCLSVTGIELQQDYSDALNSEGISCLNDLRCIEDKSIETCVSFHVIEHLPDPLDTLSILKSKIVSGGVLIIEVPHANDFLLSNLVNDAFKQFTLWSQRLILHTRDSLRRMLHHVGYSDIVIKGIQRYTLSNHLNWLVNAKPGGHKQPLSLIDTPTLCSAYADALSRIDATDTLVAVAKVR